LIECQLGLENEGGGGNKCKKENYWKQITAKWGCIHATLKKLKSNILQLNNKHLTNFFLNVTR